MPSRSVDETHNGQCCQALTLAPCVAAMPIAPNLVVAHPIDGTTDSPMLHLDPSCSPSLVLYHFYPAAPRTARLAQSRSPAPRAPRAYSCAVHADSVWLVSLSPASLAAAASLCCFPARRVPLSVRVPSRSTIDLHLPTLLANQKVVIVCVMRHFVHHVRRDPAPLSLRARRRWPETPLCVANRQYAP